MEKVLLSHQNSQQNRLIYFRRWLAIKKNDTLEFAKLTPKAAREQFSCYVGRVPWIWEALFFVICIADASFSNTDQVQSTVQADLFGSFTTMLRSNISGYYLGYNQSNVQAVFAQLELFICKFHCTWPLMLCSTASVASKRRSRGDCEMQFVHISI